jgi:hypothetical protein
MHACKKAWLLRLHVRQWLTGSDGCYLSCFIRPLCDIPCHARFDGFSGSADYHIDATSLTDVKLLASSLGGVQWVVSSPPYAHALECVQNAVAVASVGVAMKLSIAFLEPVQARASWLEANPPSKILFLSRQLYGNRSLRVGECWCVWLLKEKNDSKAVSFHGKKHT